MSTAINDLSDGIFNSGLEEAATIKIGSAQTAIKAIPLNEYQRSQMMIDYAGSDPMVLVKTTDAASVTINTDQIKTASINSNAFCTIKEKKDLGNGSTALMLQYD